MPFNFVPATLVQWSNQKFVSSEGVFPAEKNTIAASRHVRWALKSKYTKMRLRPSLGIFGVFRAQGTCPAAANVALSLLNEI